MSNTWDCVPCEMTYFAFKGTEPPYFCDCGKALRQRREGAEPYEAGSYDDDAPSLAENIGVDEPGASQPVLFALEVQ